MGDAPSSRTFTQEARRWSPEVLGGDGDKGLDPGQPPPGPLHPRWRAQGCGDTHRLKVGHRLLGTRPLSVYIRVIQHVSL